LICHGLVRDRARRGGRLGLFVKRGYADSVRFMFRDDPGIRLLVVTDDRDVRHFLRRHTDIPAETIGFDFLAADQRDFAIDFYRQAGLDYGRRWEGFHVRRDPAREEAFRRRLVPDDAPFIFLHDDPSRNLTIDRSRVPAGTRVVFPSRGLTDNVFDYCQLLERAGEIHCMDSTFRHLTDSLPTVSGRLVLHRYVKHSDVPSRHPWIKLD
jgi:hypothetical protein